jgi:hypothetical protein
LPPSSAFPSRACDATAGLLSSMIPPDLCALCSIANLQIVVFSRGFSVIAHVPASAPPEC